MSDSWLTDQIWVADGRAPGADDPSAVDLTVAVRAGVRILRATTAAGIKRCRSALPTGGQVWGTILPSGTILALQEVTEAQVQAHYAQQVAELAAAKPDAILIQSVVDLEEALVALSGGRSATNLKIGVSMVFGSGADQTETVMGQGCEDCADQLVAAGADLVGSDCGNTMDEMVLVARLMRAQIPGPILVCPNAGQQELDGDHIVYREPPEDFASKAVSLVSAGATVIGGCCGVTPEHLAAVAGAVAEG